MTNTVKKMYTSIFSHILYLSPLPNCLPTSCLFFKKELKYIDIVIYRP